VSKRKLDLLDWRFSSVGQPCESSPQVVRSDLSLEPTSVEPHGHEYRLGGHALSRGPISLVHGAKDPASLDMSSLGPIIDRFLRPGRDGNRTSSPSFSKQVHDYRTAFSLLNMLHRKGCDLLTPQTTTDEDCQQRPIPLSLESGDIESPFGCLLRYASDVCGVTTFQELRAACSAYGSRPFKSAREFVCALGLQSVSEWRRYCLSGHKPHDIPSSPYIVYKDDGWAGFGNWLGTGRHLKGSRRRPFCRR
jgi:hypothetical protein